MALSLFSSLSADLHTERPDLVNEVGCPLCLTWFDMTSVDQLSQEHIIPSAVGGELLTLTCVRCNNTQGAKLDFHLAQAMKALDGLAGLGEISSVLHNDKGHVVADFCWGLDGKTTEITIEDQQATQRELMASAIRSTALKSSVSQ